MLPSPASTATDFRSQPSANVHVLRTPARTLDLLLLSDAHWDNPKCDRALLERHLKEAIKRGAYICLNGDTFCAMQGAYDPRKSKSDIRPEHNKANYLDALVDTAAAWFAPYAHRILFVGYGNHETAILKRQETDLVRRFVDKLNALTGAQVQVGGYGGWCVLKLADGNAVASYKLKYLHGFGGGGAVTKGIIQHTRLNTAVHGADAVWMGHVHENYEQESTMEVLGSGYKVELKQVLNLRTATYKEEYNAGKGGWHVERGASPKPLGGRWLHLERRREPGRGLHIVACSTKTT